jgi:signal transduction histidine kinase
MIGEIVAGVAHEINNPLNAVAGSAEPLESLVKDVRLMLDAYKSAEASMPAEKRAEIESLKKKLDLEASLDDLAGISSVVKRATDRTVRIVQNLRNFARTPGEAVPADLNAGLDETLALLGGRLKQSNVAIEKSYGPLPEVTCRAGEIHQVFMNLVVNAIQAIESDAANGEGRIRIVTTLEGDEARIAIEDNGPGVPKEIERKIFDPFFTTKPRGQGTGLGLSISSDIVRKHGGSLTIEQVEPRGARLVMRLPSMKVPSEAASRRSKTE